MQIEQQLARFYDPDGDEPWRIALEHDDDQSVDRWRMRRRVAYRDRHLGDIAVPRDLDRFTTDLTSVPQMFTWLVPRTGSHLAAALVHDALTPPFCDPPLPDWTGPAEVTQLQADRVFRDAMADLGTPLVRRWLVWSAVTIPTVWKVSRWRAVLAYLGLAAIVVLGVLATLDLFDVVDWLPWMGAHSTTRELLLGALMALVIPLALAACMWPRGTRGAGAIVGISLAMLLHVTIAVAAVTALYLIIESVAGRLVRVR